MGSHEPLLPPPLPLELEDVETPLPPLPLELAAVELLLAVELSALELPFPPEPAFPAVPWSIVVESQAVPKAANAHMMDPIAKQDHLVTISNTPSSGKTDACFRTHPSRDRPLPQAVRNGCTSRDVPGHFGSDAGGTAVKVTAESGAGPIMSGLGCRLRYWSKKPTMY